MSRLSKQDAETLEAALIGFQYMRDQVELRIAELRGQIGAQAASRPAPSGATPGEPAPKKRTMSASARRRIALAQKKRWAAYNAQRGKAAPAKAKPAKRVLLSKIEPYGTELS